MTILLGTLVLGAAGIGVWITVGPGLPSMFSVGDSGQETAKRKKHKWRDAPYIVLVPAETLPETLPEKKASLPPPSPPPSAASSRPEAPPALVASTPAPRAAQQATQIPAEPPPPTAPRPAPQAKQEPAKPPPPAAPRTAAAKLSIAQEALEIVNGPQVVPQPVPQPAAKAERQQVTKTVAPALPPASVAPAAQVPVIQKASKPAEEKNNLQLLYKAKTESQADAVQKQQSLAAGEKVRFRRALPDSSGTLNANKMTIALAGIDALGADTQCKYTSGKSWACGRWGKYALRRLIRGRSVVCDVIEQVSETEIKARCRVAGADINKWVVRRGWGVPSGEGSEKYSDALKAAKGDKLGQWSIEAAAN